MFTSFEIIPILSKYYMKNFLDRICNFGKILPFWKYTIMEA